MGAFFFGTRVSYIKSFNELNSEQREAVEARTPILVVAGPGSGKTKMLATKAAMLLSEGDTRVGAVTFSKESALELQHRIKLMSNPAHHKRLVVGTFHGLSFKMLPRRRDIANDGQKKAHVINSLAKCEIIMNAHDAMMVLDKIKATGVRPGKDTEEGRLFHAYQQMLELNSQMDFADLLTMAVGGIEDGSIQPYPFDHLLVDEFQDTDPIQYRWMMAHAKNSSILTSVGDDDQSIYAFRSAMGFQGMRRFVLDTNSREIVLSQNYRCKHEILSAALNCVRHNQDRIDKELEAFRGKGGAVSSKVFLDSEEEAEFIVTQIGDHKKCSHAVLSRNNVDLDIVESLFRASNIPYFRPNDSSLFDYPEVAMYFGLIELITGLKKDVGVDIIFRTVQISDHDRDILHAMKIPDFAKLGRAELINNGCSEEGATLYRSFATHFNEWKQLYHRDKLSLMINGVAEWLVDKIPEKRKHSKHVVMAAKLALDRLQGDIANRLRFLKESKNNEPEEHSVRLLTLHSSKGLEFDEVYIIRSESSICPSDKSPVDEERRLFYVGITRAKDRLFVTSTAKNKPSLFVAEMMG